MGGAFAGSDWAVFQGASEAAIPLGVIASRRLGDLRYGSASLRLVSGRSSRRGSARASNAEKRPKRSQLARPPTSANPLRRLGPYGLH